MIETGETNGEAHGFRAVHGRVVAALRGDPTERARLEQRAGCAVRGAVTAECAECVRGADGIDGLPLWWWLAICGNAANALPMQGCALLLFRRDDGDGRRLGCCRGVGFCEFGLRVRDFRIRVFVVAVRGRLLVFVIHWVVP